MVTATAEFTAHNINNAWIGGPAMRASKKWRRDVYY